MARRRSSGITSLRFNQDQGCFTCCMTSGLRVYNVDPLVEKSHYGLDEVGEVSLCEMVYRTNWLLVVRARRPCTLYLLDDQCRKFKAEVVFKAPIRALRARRDKVAVVLATSIQVLALPSFARVALLRTPPGAPALCALATQPAAPQTLAAAAQRTGAVQMLDVSRAARGAQSSTPAVLACHRGALACVALSADGARLATASERGTRIRLWDAAARALLHELRRGADYADVYCLSLNAAGTHVGCVSDKGTLHVWTAARAHRTAAAAPPRTRASLALLDDEVVVVVSEDGSFHKFTYSSSGAFHRSEYEYFLQVGDDDDFIQ